MSTRRVANGFELRKGNRAVVLAAKHTFFAPEVARAFDLYAQALPAVEANDVSTVDFATSPDTLNLCRRIFHAGAVIEAREGGVWLIQDKRAIILAKNHLVYAPDIAETFDRYFLPLVPEERGDLQVLDYSRPGNLQTYRKSGLQFEMVSFPEEEDELEESFRWYRPRTGDLVFDVGAHCGVFTYHLSKLVGPEGKVIAFEPDPINFEILKRNVERHSLTNVVLQHAAVAGESGELAFSSEGTVGSMLMSVLNRSPAGCVVNVHAVTLADTFEQWGMPAFCKIDIEGAEVEVIRKSADLLRSHKTNFALDTCHLKPNGQPTNTDIESMFQSYGYQTSSAANPLMATWARPR